MKRKGKRVLLDMREKTFDSEKEKKKKKKESNKRDREQSKRIGEKGLN